MFFDIFTDLCKNKGVSCKKAAEEMGLSNSITTKWKKTNAIPDGATLVKMADYFQVSVDYLLGIKSNVQNCDSFNTQNTLSPAELSLIAAYRIAAPADRAIIDNIVSRYTHAAPSEKHA